MVRLDNGEMVNVRLVGDGPPPGAAPLELVGAGAPLDSGSASGRAGGDPRTPVRTSFDDTPTAPLGEGGGSGPVRGTGEPPEIRAQQGEGNASREPSKQTKTQSDLDSTNAANTSDQKTNASTESATTPRKTPEEAMAELQGQHNADFDSDIIEAEMRKQGYDQDAIVQALVAREAKEQEINKLLNSKGFPQTKEAAIDRLGDNATDPYALRLLEERFGPAPQTVVRGSPEDILNTRQQRIGNKEADLADAKRRHDEAVAAGNTREATKILKNEMGPLQSDLAWNEEEAMAFIRANLNREPKHIPTRQIQMANDPKSLSHKPGVKGRPGLYEFEVPNQKPGSSKYYYSADVGNGNGSGAHRGTPWKVFTKNGNGTYTYAGMADERGRLVFDANGTSIAPPINPF
jgi:hypothetical protein